MTKIDIRDFKPEPIVEITFADRGLNEIVGKGGSAVAAYSLKRPNPGENFCQIRDNNDFVNIVSKEHAENLIKALNKAIELEWLK